MHMEHRRLVNALKYLDNSSVQVDKLITDRHKQIAKYLREHNPSIDHCYDVWHVAKGISYKHIHNSIRYPHG